MIEGWEATQVGTFLVQVLIKKAWTEDGKFVPPPLLPVPMADITNGAWLSCPWRPNVALKPFSIHPVL